MAAFIQQLLTQLASWQEMLQQFGWVGLLAYAGGLVLLQMVLVPLALFAVAAGAIFGFWKGLLAVTVATNAGASVNFLLSRYIARGAVTRYLAHHEKFRLIDNAVGREGGKIIALLRVCPLPFGLSNYCYGLTAVRFQPYVFATFLATIPANCFFVWVGASAQEGLEAFVGKGRVRHPGEYALLALGLVAAFCALIYITRVAKAALARSEGAPPSEPSAS
jgi:uncharacterized membrane protein YdjX (TVP38/TMEM64 family)